MMALDVDGACMCGGGEGESVWEGAVEVTEVTHQWAGLVGVVSLGDGTAGVLQ